MPESQPALSCAELVLRGEQKVLVNDWMACVVGQDWEQRYDLLA